MGRYKVQATNEMIKKALEDNDYNLYRAANDLGYARTDYFKSRIFKNPELTALVNEHEQEKLKRVSDVTDLEFIEAIYKAHGIKSVVAKLLGLSVTNVYNRIDAHPDLQKHVYLASEEFKDIAELELFKRVEQGDLDAIKFYLSHKAKDRNYGDKLEFEANVNFNNNWNLNLLGVEELLQLENLAKKALPEGGGSDDFESPTIIDTTCVDVTDVSNVSAKPD